MIKISINKKLIGAQQNFRLSIDEVVEKGDFVALFGKSGSGKTTLLRILSGLETNVEGHIEVESKIWFNSERKIYVPAKNRGIGFVTQESVLFPNMNVQEQLVFSGGSKTDQQLLKEVIDVMEIENLLSVYPERLSGGQKQRICLARAIMQRPKILLLDEPFTGLDYEMRKQLIGLTKKIVKEYQLTAFLVSHHPDEIIKLASKVWMIDNGQIKQQGLPKIVLG